ncbi:MAG: glycosyltransferase family 39 protein [Muribaculaceae bacterium]|nr:glycosyltransferase family 39 protein [Muribaculaceae bacterium]
MQIYPSRQEKNEYRVLCFAVLMIAAMLTLPFIGIGHFYTRGEPREAIVAVAMMEQSNYILPIFQGEFAFKPPMLHWLVSLFSLPQGYVSEFTARMPSAVAFIAMCTGFFSFFARRYPMRRVFLATLILITSFEVHRAAMTCRVDMVLTAFMVGGFISLYRWHERHLKGLPIVASLLISGAILTKGPIGAILPCFALTMMMLTGGEGLKRCVIACLKIVFLAAIIPALWYIAAYHYGGDEFIALVMEENFGRFLGKMTYESHENGVFYYFPILFGGLMPWTLLAVCGLFTEKWKKITPKTWWRQFSEMHPIRRWSLIVSICVFVFYLIPKSKRSVYLLPLYPFISLLIADYTFHLLQYHRKAVRVFALTLASLAILFSIAMISVRHLDLSILGDSRSSQRLICQLAELQKDNNTVTYLIMAIIPLLTAVVLLWKRALSLKPLTLAVCSWIACLFTIEASLNPAIKNSVPDYRFSQTVKHYTRNSETWYFNPRKDETLYCIAFYLGDKVKEVNSAAQLPPTGYVMLRLKDAEAFEQQAINRNIARVLTTDNEFTSIKHDLVLYRFE